MSLFCALLSYQPYLWFDEAFVWCVKWHEYWCLKTWSMCWFYWYTYAVYIIPYWKLNIWWLSLHIASIMIMLRSRCDWWTNPMEKIAMAVNTYMMAFTSILGMGHHNSMGLVIFLFSTFMGSPRYDGDTSKYFIVMSARVYHRLLYLQFSVSVVFECSFRVPWHLYQYM